jgi:hypothetical protein
MIGVWRLRRRLLLSHGSSTAQHGNENDDDGSVHHFAPLGISVLRFICCALDGFTSLLYVLARALDRIASRTRHGQSQYGEQASQLFTHDLFPRCVTIFVTFGHGPGSAVPL